MPLLLYCIVRADKSASIASGVCESAVQSRELSGLRVYWSEIADPERCLGDADSLKKAALRFHQVLREILATTTPLPFRFPTLLEDEGAVEQHVAAEHGFYRGALDRIGDALQYEIVGSWASDEQADLATPVSGREYLKRRQEAAVRIAAIDSKLRSVTADVVQEWRARQERKTHRWFALVPRDRREQFIASLKTAAPSQGVRLRLSGPWPPSEFVSPRGEHG